MSKRWNILAVLVLVLLYSCTGCTSQQYAATQPISVQLIMKYWTGEYRDEIIAGARTAAMEYGVELSTQSFSFDDTEEKQAKMIEDAMAGGADAIIASVEESDAMSAALKDAAANNVPVILIDSYWANALSENSIDTDLDTMMNEVAQRLKDLIHESGNICVINSSCTVGGTTEKMNVFAKATQNSTELHVNTINYNTPDETVLKEIIIRHLKDHKIDAIIAFNDISSIAAASALKEMNKSDAVLLAFGSSLRLVEEMEEGRVHVMIAENAFSKGYLAVQSSVAAVKKTEKPKRISLRATLITHENLYLPENQKLIFPLN